MGKNINQIATQATTFQNLDKLYLGRSPYGVTDDRWYYYSSLLTGLATNFLTITGNLSNINNPATALTNLNGLSLNGGTLVGDLILPGTVPTLDNQAITKAYADTLTSNLNYKEAVNYATTAALVGIYNNGASGVGATITLTATGALSIDGSAVVVGNRILVKDQVTTFQNGIYDITNAGSIGVSAILTRSTDYDNSSVGEISQNDIIPVISGTLNAGAIWRENGAGPFTVGVTAITFVIYSVGTYVSGNGGISISGNQISVPVGGISNAMIANAAVTYGKIQNVSAFSLIGNPTGSSASALEITLGSGLAFSGTTLNAVPSLDLVTVGSTNAQYTTLADALTAGKRNLLLVSSTTEVANFTFNSGAIEYVTITGINNSNINFGAFSSFNVTNNTNVSLLCNNIQIYYNYASDKSLIVILDATSGCNFNFYDSVINNNSTAAGFSWIADTGPGNLSGNLTNCQLYLNNGVNGGFNTQGGFFNNVQFNGGGNNCTQFFQDVFGVGLNACVFLGTFQTPTPSTPHMNLTNGKIISLIIVGSDIIIKSTNLTVSQADLIIFGSLSLILQGGGASISDYVSGTGGKLYLTDGAIGNNITNSNIDFIDDSLAVGVVPNTLISNTIVNNAVTLGAIQSGNYKFSNIIFGNALTMDTLFTANNIEVANGLIIANSRSRVSGSTIGFGSGVGTVTVNNTSTNSIVTGNNVRVAIVDNGTNTQLGFNPIN